MVDDSSAFIGRLLEKCSAFAPLCRAHLAEYDHLLPHVLMGDFTRWYIQLFRYIRGGTEEPEHDSISLLEVSSFLEQEWARGIPQVTELLAVSFLENLHQADDDYQELRATLGPGMAHHLMKIE